MLSFKRVNRVAFVALVILAGFFLFSDFPLWPILLVMGLWLALTVMGSFNIQRNYFLRAFHHRHGISDKKIAITFDDGPHPTITPRVLDILDKYDAKATFFCIGKQMENYPYLAELIVESGHTIGQHSYSHSNGFGFFSAHKVLNEIKKYNKLTNSILGKRLLLFRPPFGVTNPAIAKAVKSAGLTVIGWRIRSLDTITKSTEKIFERIVKDLRPADIILLHDTNERCPVVLERLLQFTEEQTYRPVTVDHLLNIKAYE